MLYRKIFSFLGFKIVLKVSISSKNYDIIITSIGFDFLSKSCLTSQTYFKEPYLHVVLPPTKSLGDHL